MHAAKEIVSEEKSVTHKSGARTLAKLREMGAPALVVGRWSGA